MRRLIEGFRRFHHDIFPEKKALFERLADHQLPRALFITCSDSRVVPDLITQAEPGDLFIIRNAGNIVPTAGTHAGGVSATIEYAVMALEVRHIIVCGHTNCGAMKGILHPELVQQMPMVSQWLSHAEAARRIVNDNYPNLVEEEKLERLTEENVVVQVDHLRTHPSVASRLAAGAIEIHGWLYNILTGDIHAYDAKDGQFHIIGEQGDIPTATPPVRHRHNRETGVLA